MGVRSLPIGKGNPKRHEYLTGEVEVFLLRPVSAQALVNCVNCNSGSRCCDGYTEFCCTINDGVNACPSNTFIGGWWKCTNNAGAGACHKEGVRFYIDCNIKPGRSCT